MNILSRKICGIYKITNLMNGMCYVGQSVNIEKRWKSHKHEGKQNHNNYLHRAINKYGINNFSFEVLETCDIEMLDDLEKSYIKSFNCVAPNGYNMDLGGTVRKEIGAETREKRRIASTGSKNWNYGKPKSEAFKNFISNILSKPVNQYDFDGTYINTYPNARSIQDFPDGYKNISLCCNGKTNSAYGYQWRFAKNGISNIESIKGNRVKNNSRVVQYDMDGTYIATHLNLRSASDATGVKYKSISAVCKGARNETGGFIWRYEDDSN